MPGAASTAPSARSGRAGQSRGWLRSRVAQHDREQVEGAAADGEREEAEREQVHRQHRGGCADVAGGELRRCDDERDRRGEPGEQGEAEEGGEEWQRDRTADGPCVLECEPALQRLQRLLRHEDA